jgi:hypothetical protein
MDGEISTFGYFTGSMYAEDRRWTLRHSLGSQPIVCGSPPGEVLTNDILNQYYESDLHNRKKLR